MKVQHDTSFRNILWCILFVLLLWCWLSYWPDRAIATIERVNMAARAQINTWTDREIFATDIMVNEIVTSQDVIADTVKPEIDDMVNTGAMTSGNAMTGVSESTGNTSDIWAELNGDILDSETTIATNTGSNNTGSININKATENNIDNSNIAILPEIIGDISIRIGGQEIIIDGDLDEDIIINGGKYRIIIQKQQ